MKSIGEETILQHIRKPCASPIEQHCLPCHQAKDIYKTPSSSVAWKVIIRKMSELDEQIVPLARIDEIADYLVKTQAR